jgi:hypothetical protein
MFPAYAARGFICILARPSPQSSTTFFTSSCLSTARSDRKAIADKTVKDEKAVR